MTEHVWQEQNRHLIEGDILRIKVENKTHPDYGKYIYAICSGGGFGCNHEGMGNAIFVYRITTNLEELISTRDQPVDRITDDGERWERYWRVEYLVE